MIYEMRYYNSKNDWEDENDSCFIAWENKDTEAKNNFEISGKLLKYLGDSNKKFEVPEGIETIGACVFVNPRWDIFDSNIQEVIIPASVKKIEEGAFEWTEINKITIHPDSPCGVVINDGLYTKDGKTLLWILKKNNEEGYEIPNGVKRIGLCAIGSARALGVFKGEDGFETTIVVPESVEEIGFDEEHEYSYMGVIIKASKGSYAIKFAKEHKIKYIEI